MPTLDNHRATTVTARRTINALANTKDERIAAGAAALILWSILHDPARRQPMCGKMISKNGTQTGVVPGNPNSKGK